MKNNKILIILLILVNIALLTVCSVFYLKKDKQPPKISFSADETIYMRDIDNAMLTSCVSATDNKDGDISDRIVIEKILENKNNNTAVVYYAVCDYSGNVAKASREYKANYGASYQDIDEADTEDDEVESEDAEAVDENQSDEDNNDSEEDVEEDTEEENEEDIAEDTAVEENTQAEEEKNKAEEERKKAEEEALRAAEAEAARKAAVSPYIELKYKDVKVQAGSNVAWADVILTLRDDKDNYSTLFGNLVATKFDNNKKGDYTVTIYTTDSDKNQSNIATLLVHVI